MKKYNLLYFVLLFVSCHQKETTDGDWIKGSENEKITTIEKHFRGFDNAMVEAGYRYQELYWAGQDQNWEYANYQVEKIKLAIQNGLERRPKRAQSAQQFLNHALPEMQKAIQTQDTVVFNKVFANLTINCNNCHAMEKVTFFNVNAPKFRQSPIQK